MSNIGNINTYFGKKEPVDRSAVWIKPVNGGFEIYAFLNGWRQYNATGIQTTTGNIVCGVSYTTADGDGTTGDYLCIIQSSQDGSYETIYVDLAEITREIKERLAQAENDIDSLEYTTAYKLVAYGELNSQSKTIDLMASDGTTLSSIDISMAYYSAGDGIIISDDNVISTDDDYIASLSTLMTEDELDEMILSVESSTGYGLAQSMNVTQ